MNSMNEEREINLKELFYNACKQWRRILIIALAFIFVALAMQNKKIFAAKQLSDGIRSGITAVLVGYLLGIFVVGFYYMIKLILNDSIKSSSELWDYSKINLIGVLPNIEKESQNAIDLFLKRMAGVKIKKDSYNELVDCIAQEIKTEIDIKSNGQASIALVSSYSADDASELECLLKNKLPSQISLRSAGDIRSSAAGITSASGADYVVLVERQFKSTYSDLTEICRKLNCWNKEILGIVLLNVDAI